MDRRRPSRARQLRAGPCADARWRDAHARAQDIRARSPPRPLTRACPTLPRSRAMKRTWSIIGVRTVPGSFKWYQALFGQPETPPDKAPPGNGLLLFFRLDDFDLALKRARALVRRLEEEPHVNPNTQTREFSL